MFDKKAETYSWSLSLKSTIFFLAVELHNSLNVCIYGLHAMIKCITEIDIMSGFVYCILIVRNKWYFEPNRKTYYFERQKLRYNNII